MWDVLTTTQPLQTPANLFMILILNGKYFGKCYSPRAVWTRKARAWAELWISWGKTQE